MTGIKRRILMAAVCLLLAPGMPPLESSIQGSALDSLTITVTSVTLSARPLDTNCPAEFACVNVNWSARALSPVRILSYKVTVKATVSGQQQTDTIDNLPSSATTAKAKFFTGNISGPYTATVIATYSTTTSVNNSGTFP